MTTRIGINGFGRMGRLAIRALRHHPAVAQQRVDLGLAAAEGLEGFQRRAAAAHCQDLAPEALASLGVEQAALARAGLLEGGEGVGRQHLGPLVAVVARRVAAGEDVREAVREAVPGGRDHHRDFLAHLVEQGHHALDRHRARACVA